MAAQGLASNNQTCQACRKQPASAFCSCNSTPAFLCTDCSLLHQTKPPLGLHLIIPISWLGSSEEYMRVLHQLNQGKTALRGNVEVYEKCCGEVTDLTNTCIQWLSQYRESWVGWLQREKEQLAETIGTAIQEAESFVTSRSALVSPLARAIFTQTPDELRVIRYSVTLPDLQSLSQTWIAYENSLPSLCERCQSLPVSVVSQREREGMGRMANSAAPSLFMSLANQTVDISSAVSLPAARSSDVGNPSQQAKADFHRPSEEDFHRNIRELPKTIGRHRLSIECCFGGLPWELRQRCMKVCQPYSAWRRSKEDGNSFYRCLGNSLLEHYCRPDTPKHEALKFANDLMDQRKHFHFSNCNISEIPKAKPLMQAIRKIFIAINQQENALQLAQYLLQGSPLDTSLVFCFRHYIRNFAEISSQDTQTLANQIIQWGTEAGEEIALAAARCFSVVLHVITIDTGSRSIVVNVYGPDSQGWYPSISMLQLDGHYSSLVRREVHEADHYDFTHNTYNPVPTGQVIGYMSYPLA